MSTFDKLRDTLCSTLKVPPASITATTRDEDVAAWDSLGQVNLIMAIEQAFDIYVEVEDFGNLNSVPAIMAYLAKQGVS